MRVLANQSYSHSLMNILLITESINSSYVPQTKEIDDFWSILTDKVNNGNWQTSSQKTIEKLRCESWLDHDHRRARIIEESMDLVHLG